MEEQQTTEPQVIIQTDVETKISGAQKFWSFTGNNFLALSILTAGLMVSGSLLYTNGLKANLGAQINNIPSDQQPDSRIKVDVSVDDDTVMGNKDAKVTIIEFSDYQCPFCRSFWKEALVQIRKDYVDTGKAKFVYRDYPLSFHPMAMLSAQAAECAGDQGKYWQMHDKIFSEQDKLGQGTVTYSVDDIKKWAAATGLNAGQFNQCLDSGKYKSEVEKDTAAGTAAGVSGTPSVFINGRLIVGAQPYASFKAIIDEELKNK